MLSDFEVKHKEEVERPQSLTVGIPVQHRDQPLMPDEIPIESGSVLRQKNEIEMKFGSSPRHSKLSPDHNLCPPSVTPSDAARLTPTLEKYCANDILTLTEEVPEGFLDEDAEYMQECDWQKQLQSESSELSCFPDQDMPEGDVKQPKILLDAGSLQFQRSFSYRESCQQKRSKPLPSFSRSASLRLRCLPDVAKNNSAFSSTTVSRTGLSYLASFSSTEVCSRLLKEKNQQNESASANKMCDAGKERKQVEHADLVVETDKQAQLSNVLNTVQLPDQHLPAEASAIGDLADTDFKCDLNQVGSQSSKTKMTKSAQDQQTVPGSAFVFKVASQQSSSHSSGARLFAESPHLMTHQSDKDVPPCSLTGSSEGSKTVSRNAASETVNSCLKGDGVQESDLKMSNEQPVVNNSQPQSAQVDSSSVVGESAIQGVQPLSFDRHDEASSVTQFVAGHTQSADIEQSPTSPLKKRYSFSDKSASFISTEPGKLWRSQSVRNKSSSFLQRTSTTGDSEPAKAQKVKKPYGKSHPLSKLSSEYLSRDCSRTIKNVVCDHDST